MLDPDDARLNPRVGDVWRHGLWRFKVSAISDGRVTVSRKLGRLNRRQATGSVSSFIEMTQTAELIERGEE